MRLGINGFGRIGRCILRAIFEEEYDEVDYIQINASSKLDDLIHQIQFDSTHGRFLGQIQRESDNSFTINGTRVETFSQRDIEKTEWKDLDVLMECTGAFKKTAQLSAHLERGAKRVVLSCPAGDKEMPTIVFGANEDSFNPSSKIVSIGSCTTNALAPVAKVINDELSIQKGFITTVHAYTNDQNILDGSHKDLRRSRAAALSMVPTSTGAAKAIHLVIPSLEGKLAGSAIRVPTPNVSLVDCTFVVSKNTTAEEVNELIKAGTAKQTQYRSLTYTEQPIVSIDMNHNPASTIVDLKETRVVDGNLVRLLTWYDNEWAFSVRMLDMARLMLKNG